MLQKPKIGAGLMGHLARTQALPYLYLTTLVDITRWKKDRNVISEWREKYLTSEILLIFDYSGENMGDYNDTCIN